MKCDLFCDRFAYVQPHMKFQEFLESLILNLQ